MQRKGDSSLISHSCIIPGKGKINPKGEDAVQCKDNVHIVCDGVGGWASRGIDPSVQSNKLCESTGDQLHSHTLPNSDPQEWFRAAIAHGIRSTLPIQGSSTITLAYFNLRDESPLMYTANIGDSGQCVIRDGKMITRSKEQQQSFNFPQQIASEEKEANLAEINKQNILKKDLVILGTDGIWDNLFDEDIEAAIGCIENSNSESQTEEIADRLAKLAQVFSYNPKRNGPFAQKGQLAAKDPDTIKFYSQQFGREVSTDDQTGGKPDDISVSVIQIN